MRQKTLDYRRPVREEPALPWYKTDLAASGVTTGIILAADGWLVWNADKSWGFWLWVFVFIPVANGVLALVLLACSPIVRKVSGVSAWLHVWVTLIGCASAIFVDAAIIFAQLHGC
jgi:hypothetical protein